MSYNDELGEYADKINTVNKLSKRIVRLIIRYPIILFLLAVLLTLAVMIFEITTMKIINSVDWIAYANAQLIDYD